MRKTNSGRHRKEDDFTQEEPFYVQDLTLEEADQEELDFEETEEYYEEESWEYETCNEDEPVAKPSFFAFIGSKLRGKRDSEEQEDEAYYETAGLTEEEEWDEYCGAEELQDTEEYYEAQESEDTEYYEAQELEDTQEYYEAEEYGDTAEYYETEEYFEEEGTIEASEYCGMDEAGEELEFFELEDLDGEAEYFEADEEDWEEQPKHKSIGRQGNLLERILYFLRNMNTMDRVVAGTGVFVLIIAIVTCSIYFGSALSAKEVGAFAQIGNELDGIAVIGEDGLMAVADAQMAKAEAAQMIENEKEEETEEEQTGEITVGMSLTSIQKDLKIKFINKETGKLIASVPFEVTVTGENKKSVTYQDDDKDGVIYKTDLAAGKYTVTMSELEGYEEYEIPAEAQTVTVKDKIAYEKVDVSDEIKKESEVNAAAEDTKVQDTAVESVNKDTVAFVESTKTEIEGGESYQEIDKKSIPAPAVAALQFGSGIFRRLSAVTEPETEAESTEEEVTEPESSEEEMKSTVSLSPSSLSMNVGEEAKLNASTDVGGVSISFSSSNTQVASVDGSGKVKGAGPGTATITATPSDGGTAATCSVTINDKPTTTISAGSLSIKKGETSSLSVKVTGPSEDVKWETSSQDIVALSGDSGTSVTLTAKKTGEATVKATANGVSAQCKVTVTDSAKLTVTINPASSNVAVGKTVKLEAKVTNFASDAGVKWTSSDNAVAKVGDDGIVTGVKKGTATITASTVEKNESGASVKAECKITVTDPAENDTKTALKDSSGKQVYVQEADGSYRPAVYADYNKYDKFYIKAPAYKYTGWQTIDGNVYYYDANGNYVTGEHVIQGAPYTFDSSGVLVTTSGNLGIDVSKWNGNIDWNAVKSSGVSYVIIRCGYRGSSTGALIEDPKFASNIKGATAAGLKVGVYFFTQAVNEVEAVEEASMVLSLIKNYKITYPVFLDVESSGGRGDAISTDMRTKVCVAFSQTIANSGYTAGIYANKTWLNSKINTGSLGSYKIWLAQYAASPTYSGRYNMWQYTSKGRVAGISGDVDMNLSYLGY